MRYLLSSPPFLTIPSPTRGLICTHHFRNINEKQNLVFAISALCLKLKESIFSGRQVSFWVMMMMALKHFLLLVSGSKKMERPTKSQKMKSVFVCVTVYVRVCVCVCWCMCVFLSGGESL